MCDLLWSSRVLANVMRAEAWKVVLTIRCPSPWGQAKASPLEEKSHKVKLLHDPCWPHSHHQTHERSYFLPFSPLRASLAQNVRTSKYVWITKSFWQNLMDTLASDPEMVNGQVRICGFLPCPKFTISPLFHHLSLLLLAHRIITWNILGPWSPSCYLKASVH